MQLGELQNQLARFNNRGASVVALSVDPVTESDSLIRRLKLGFNVVSDESQQVMQAYHVQNPDTNELALHAVFIVDEDRKIFYRKVASRRPLSQELLDAIDYHYGQYPLGDASIAETNFIREYPRNNFQALIEISAQQGLPASVSTESLLPIVALLKQGESDDSIIAFRRFISEQGKSSRRDDYLWSAAWLTTRALGIEPDAIATGKALSAVLSRLRAARDQSPTMSSQHLRKLEQELDAIRGKVQLNARRWKLSYAKSMLRSYRKLVIAGLPD